MPSPPQKLGANDVVRPVEQGSGQATYHPETQPLAGSVFFVELATIKNEVSRGDYWIIHEGDVDTRNVKWKSRRDHDRRLGLPKVVDDGESHEEHVVGGASHKRSDENEEVGVDRSLR